MGCHRRMADVERRWGDLRLAAEFKSKALEVRVLFHGLGHSLGIGGSSIRRASHQALSWGDGEGLGWAGGGGGGAGGGAQPGWVGG